VFLAGETRAEKHTQAERCAGNLARRDILLITTDQFNPCCMGCAGDPVIKTPNLDRLTHKGAGGEVTPYDTT
jgi:hypothetical protein